MKRTDSWHRSRLDAILSSAPLLWSTRAILSSLLLLAGLEVWAIRKTGMERIAKAREMILAAQSLEDSVASMRSQAAPAQLDSARLAASNGVFANWEDLAGWLEHLRADALSRGWGMDWELVHADSIPSVSDGIRRQSVQLHIVLPRADFDGFRAFLRQSANPPGRSASMERLEGSGDREGIAEVRWTLVLWVRDRHV